MALSSKEMPEDQIETSDRINEFYPSKGNKPDWHWRVPYKTATYELGDGTDKNKVFSQLDACLLEISSFEADLKDKIIGVGR